MVERQEPEPRIIRPETDGLDRKAEPLGARVERDQSKPPLNLESGLAARIVRDSIRMSPPLVITFEEVDTLFTAPREVRRDPRLPKWFHEIELRLRDVLSEGVPRPDDMVFLGGIDTRGRAVNIFIPRSVFPGLYRYLSCTRTLNRILKE